MALELDHVVVAARTLDEGAAWIEARLGIAPAGGGKHAVMGTHNRLLSLGPAAYLEVMAIDPEAPPPGRPRWFSLDTPEMAARLESGPALVHWVARTDDIRRDVALFPGPRPEILEMQRGDFRWRMGVPADGLLPDAGTRPTLIQWLGDRPSSVLRDAGVRLERLRLHHPRAALTLESLDRGAFAPRGSVESVPRGPVLQALFQASRGTVALPE